MIDDLYVYARLHELSRQCAGIVAQRSLRAALAAPAANSAPGSHAGDARLGEPAAPLARA